MLNVRYLVLVWDVRNKFVLFATQWKTPDQA